MHQRSSAGGWQLYGCLKYQVSTSVESSKYKGCNNQISALFFVDSYNMIELKYDCRTSRGSAINELTDQGCDINQGILTNVETCSLCKNAPDNLQVLKCMNCKEKFHNCCVLKPVTSEMISALYSNRSLWWFCLGCLTTKEKETQNPDHTSNIDQLKTMMEEMKDSIIQDVKTMIDNKLQSPKEAELNIIHNSNQEVPNSFSSSTVTQLRISLLINRR